MHACRVEMRADSTFCKQGSSAPRHDVCNLTGLMAAEMSEDYMSSHHAVSCPDRHATCTLRQNVHHLQKVCCPNRTREQ